MPNFVYVCMGSTGEYSDRTEWPVRAFLHKEKCEQFVHDVSYEYRKVHTYNIPRSGRCNLVNPLDPDMRVDYTGTMYYMMEVLLDDN